MQINDESIRTRVTAVQRRSTPSDPNTFGSRLAMSFWVCVGALILDGGLATIAVVRDHAIGSFVLFGSMGILVFGVPILTLLMTSWSFGQDALTVRTLWRSDEIAYSGITAIEDASSKWEPGNHPIAVHYGKSGSALRPQGVAKLDPKNRSSFLAALRTHVPQVRGGDQTCA